MTEQLLHRDEIDSIIKHVAGDGALEIVRRELGDVSLGGTLHDHIMYRRGVERRPSPLFCFCCAVPSA